jgi:hypothetical protein
MRRWPSLGLESLGLPRNGVVQVRKTFSMPITGSRIASLTGKEIYASRPGAYRANVNLDRHYLRRLARSPQHRAGTAPQKWRLPKWGPPS